MRKILFTALLLPLFFTACTDNNAAEEDTEAPVIEMLSPAANTNFKTGDTLRIKAAISDNDELHEGEVKLTNISTNTDLLKYDLHVHELKQYTVDTMYIIKADDNANLKLLITASDHHEHNTIKETELFFK